jgi:signal transduction histidine kinase
MRKFAVILVVLFTSLLNQTSGMYSDKSRNKNILILFSFAPSTPAYLYILDGIRDKLTAEFGDSYNVHTEYLETEKYPKGQYPREKFDLYNRKYFDLKLDLLICVGIDIIATVKNYADPYLLNLPTISLDYDFSKYGLPCDLSLNNQTAVIGLKFDAGRTIREAIDIFQNTSSIYFISGASYTDHLFMNISYAESKTIPDNIKVTFVHDKSMEEVLKLVRDVPKNSLIVVSNFYADSNKVPYFNPEVVRLIRRTANTPVFTYIDMGLGEGSFGSKIISFRKVGPLIGETAVRILNGTDPVSIKISQNDYWDYLLDWRELEVWNLTGLEHKKAGCTVLYREVTFFGRYKLALIAGILFLFLQSFLITVLIRMNRKQKNMTRQIVEADRRFMDIIREDRILRTGLLTVSLSHELNQPLTAILSTAQAGKRFLDSNKSDPELMKELLSNIVESDNRAASILKSIRGLMKLEKREKEKVDLNNLIIEISDLYKCKAIELNNKITLQLIDKPVFVIADTIQIQQVLLNFISNASQSIEKNANNLNLIIISETLDDDYVRISVRDFGGGIDEVVKESLFKPFVTSRKEGTGVGLAISRFIIEDHQGKIWAENKQDGGAEFSFKLKVIYE